MEERVGVAEIVPHECVECISWHMNEKVIDVSGSSLSWKRAEVIRNLFAGQSSRQLDAMRVSMEGNTRAQCVTREAQDER